MTDLSLAPTRAPSANTLALVTGGVVTLAALGAAALKVEAATVMAIAGPMIAGCLAIFRSPAHG